MTFKNSLFPLLMVFIAIASVAIFRTFDLDIWFTSLFYQANSATPWPLRYTPAVEVMYESARYITLGSLFLCLSIFCISFFNPSIKPYRHMAVLVFCFFIIGPGLIVNYGFKDNWGRPRPAEVDHFTGKAEYVPLMTRNEKGRNIHFSFPSGHSAIGFSFIVFWFALRLKHIKLARLSLAATLIVGSAMSMARIVAGGHFLSDVLWSWIICYFVAYLLNLFLKSDELLAKNEIKLSSKEKMVLSITILTLVVLAIQTSL